MSRPVLAAFAAMVLSLAGGPSLAAPTLGVEGFGSFSSYALDDVNGALSQANEFDGARYDEIGGQASGGFGLRLWATPSWMFSAVYEPLPGRSEDAAAPGEEVDVKGASFQLSGAWFWDGGRPWKLGLGAGVGLYSLDGRVKTFDVTQDLKGTNAGMQLLGLGEWTVNSSLGVTAGAGYRMADVEIDGSGNGSTVDYSGFMGRLGLAFYWPAK